MLEREVGDALGVGMVDVGGRRVDRVGTRADERREGLVEVLGGIDGEPKQLEALRACSVFELATPGAAVVRTLGVAEDGNARDRRR